MARIDGGWDPENEEAWERLGRRTARRNLAVSVFALFMSFSVSTLGALLVVHLNEAGFDLSKQQLFSLTALTGLVGATGRFFYTYLPALMGGRTFTLASLAIMNVPLVGLGFAVQDPASPFWLLALWFSLLGLALAHFSGSMANIAEFFPKRIRGTANGINAGVGNLGVAAAYFMAPLVIGSSFGAAGGVNAIQLHQACFLLLPPILLAMVLTALFMDDIRLPRQSLKEAVRPFARLNTWLMSVVYSCGFGSFIGYSMAFALIVSISFPDANSEWYLFLGPLVGAGVRPLGGWLSDRVRSGARVALASLALMLAATIGVIASLSLASFPLFFACMMALFLGTGLVNGASFRMIPHLFDSRTESAQVTGIVSAFAAYGAFFIPQLFRFDYQLALFALAAFTLATTLLTWTAYARKEAFFPC